MNFYALKSIVIHFSAFESHAARVFVPCLSIPYILSHFREKIKLFFNKKPLFSKKIRRFGFQNAQKYPYMAYKLYNPNAFARKCGTAHFRNFPSECVIWALPDAR